MMWTFALAFCCFHIKAVFSLTNPEEYVNTLGGSDSRVDLSRGNTLPLVGRPWGFNSWAPMTDTDPTYSSWWFHPNDRRYYGLRCTHQPSPWIDDYGQFRLVASISSPQHGGVGQYSGYKPSSSTWKPYYFNATLLAYGTEQSFTTVEFTPSTHGGILHAHFPKYEADTNFIQTRRIAIVLNGGLDASEVIEAGDNNPPGIRGKVVKNAGGAGTNFGHYFVAYVYSGENGVEIVKPIATSHDSEMAYLEFDPKNPATEHITVRIATSLISYEQASFNLQDEVGADQAFSDIFEDAKQEWNDVLTRVNIKSLNDEYSMVEKIKLYEVFYSNLYRASLFPRQLSEKSLDTGELIHWSPYDPEGAVYDGALTSDSGFWDAYIVVYPYLSLVNRESLGTMIQGWVNAYSEGGWLPKWASPGYRGSMVGTMGDVTLSDAIVKKIPGFDVEKAYEAVRKDAFVEPPSDRDGVGRVCLPAYVKYGYIPRGSLATDGGTCDEVVSRTLNYMQSDYSIAQAALKLGKTDDANLLLSRAYNYSMVFNSDTGFMQSKYVNGKWTDDFDEFAWGTDYTEAGPWQFRFYVPFDPQGLAVLYSNADLDMCEVLEKMQTMPGVVHLGGYSTEIHEQVEMTENCWGQYAHNNQPSHHVLYMFNGIDSDGVRGACAAKGQFYLRKVQRELYNYRPAMYAGDEDNGEMSAWYVMSSLGLFSLSPGSSELLFGVPLYEEVEILIDVESQLYISIYAENNAPDNVYIQSVSWNGVDISSQNGIAYDELMKGGKLRFTMGSKPFQNLVQ